MLVKCRKCNKSYAETFYNWKYLGKKRSIYCKKCSRAYIKSHYYNNRKYYINKADKRNILVKKICTDFVGPYLKSHPCVDCGENDILVLEFDHKDPKLKFSEIAKIFRNRGSLESIKAEVEKCEVRCANCHHRKTAKETNSWRLKYIN